MKLKKRYQFAAAAILAGLSLSASADLITFDPTGTAGAAGNISNVALFDWAPGSALATGVNSAAGLTVGTNFTTYFQANLGTVQAADTSALFTNGGGGAYFTAVAGFGETVLTCSAGGGGFCTNATFGFWNGPVNFFDIYAVGGTANNLTGAGFTGTSVLHGVVVPSGFGSNFALSSSTPQNLDQSPNGNDWVGTTTVSGTGSSDITVLITGVNSAYFPDLMVGGMITFSAFNTSQILPFKQVDPSRCMANGSADCAIAANIGTFNGAPIGAGGGPNVIFQADANQSFTRVVPEPMTLALLGVGLLGLAMTRRRQTS